MNEWTYHPNTPHQHWYMINMCEQNPIQSHDFVRLQLAVWSQRLQGGDGHTLQLGKTWIWYDMIWCQHGGYIGKIHCSWNMAKIWLTYSLNIVELLQTYCWKHQTQHENLKFPQLKQWWSLVRMIQTDQNVDSKENRSPKCRITMIERQARVMWGPILCLDQRS